MQGTIFNMNLEQYLPILFFVMFSGLIGIILLIIGFFFSPKETYSEKLSPYECGFEAFSDARMQFDIRYYLVALLFILFDIEVAFLFPWVIIQETVAPIGFWAIMIFLSILTVGFVYEWKKGALDWM